MIESSGEVNASDCDVIEALMHCIIDFDKEAQ